MSAGQGRRLRPLTLFVPKPLLPIRGEPVAGRTLRSLARAGCELAVINLHHLGETIEQSFGSHFAGLPILYSSEAELQGTLGALYPRRRDLRAADLVLLVNGDTLCDWPWRRLIQRHQRTEADATLLLHRRAPEESLGGGIAVDGGGAVVGLRNHEPCGQITRRHVFAGAHVLSARLLDRVGEGPADIIDGLYLPLLRRGGRITGLVTSRRWHDLGTPQRYLDAALSWSRGRWPRRRRFLASNAEIDSVASIEQSVVEAGSVVESEAQIEGSLVLSGARVGRGSKIRDSLIGPGVRVPHASTIDRRMVNRVRAGFQPSAAESQVGDLIYTPLVRD